MLIKCNFYSNPGIILIIVIILLSKVPAIVFITNKHWPVVVLLQPVIFLFFFNIANTQIDFFFFLVGRHFSLFMQQCGRVRGHVIMIKQRRQKLVSFTRDLISFGDCLFVPPLPLPTY